MSHSSLECKFAAFRLLPLDLRGGLHAARLLALLPHDRRIVVLPVDQARRDIVVAIAADSVLGARAPQAPHHGILFRLARPLQFLRLGLAV